MKIETAFNTAWRKTAATIYRRPVDSRILGSAELDITDLLDFVRQKRAQGVKVTPTHIFAMAAARALKHSVPELNTYIRRGNVISRQSVDVTVSVLQEGGQMGSVLIKDADQLNLAEFAANLHREVQLSRKGAESKLMRKKNLLAAIPWPFRNMLFRLIRTITVQWGLAVPGLGISANSFGSFVVSNIGNVGLDIGFPALFPTSNVSFVLILGAVRTKPWVVNGAIVPRNIIQVGAALDHRVVDASHGGKLFSYLRQVVGNPSQLEE